MVIIFLPDALNKLFNIKIFLDPEFELNKSWLKNKINSDNSFQKREIKRIKKLSNIIF